MLYQFFILIISAALCIFNCTFSLNLSLTKTSAHPFSCYSLPDMVSFFPQTAVLCRRKRRLNCRTKTEEKTDPHIPKTWLSNLRLPISEMN